jgi:hypothetical protein
MSNTYKYICSWTDASGISHIENVIHIDSIPIEKMQSDHNIFFCMTKIITHSHGTCEISMCRLENGEFNYLLEVIDMNDMPKFFAMKMEKVIENVLLPSVPVP